MFDLNIEHYNKTELQSLLNLPNSNYSKKDVEESTHTLISQVQMNATISQDLKERTNSFLVKVKETIHFVIFLKIFVQILLVFVVIMVIYDIKVKMIIFLK